jgi:hypothetical protein
MIQDLLMLAEPFLVIGFVWFSVSSQSCWGGINQPEANLAIICFISMIVLPIIALVLGVNS